MRHVTPKWRSSKQATFNVGEVSIPWRSRELTGKAFPAVHLSYMWQDTIHAKNETSVHYSCNLFRAIEWICTLIDSVFFASTRVVLSITAFMEESRWVKLRRPMKFLISRKGSAYLFKAGILKLPSFNGHTFFSRMIAVSYNLTWQSSLSHIYMHESYWSSHQKCHWGMLSVHTSFTHLIYTLDLVVSVSKSTNSKSLRSDWLWSFSRHLCLNSNGASSTVLNPVISDIEVMISLKSLFTNYTK